MNFDFIQEQTNALILQDITHLQDALTEYGVETPLAFGVAEDMELEQLQAAKTLLEEAVELAKKQAAEEARLKIRPCHIGPYANGFCTICGLRDPNT